VAQQPDRGFGSIFLIVSQSRAHGTSNSNFFVLINFGSDILSDKVSSRGKLSNVRFPKQWLLDRLDCAPTRDADRLGRRMLTDWGGPNRWSTHLEGVAGRRIEPSYRYSVCLLNGFVIVDRSMECVGEYLTRMTMHPLEGGEMGLAGLSGSPMMLPRTLIAIGYEQSYSISSTACEINQMKLKLTRVCLTTWSWNR